MRSVYDTVAEEYEEITQRMTHTDEVAQMLLTLTGHGPGICVDVGCGTGAVSEALTDAGWTVTGVDLSVAELRIAVDGHRIGMGAVGDAMRLPLRRESIDLVVSTYTHTDVASWQETLISAAQALRPGGRIAYIGMHPAFVGPHAQRVAGMTVLHSGYYRDTNLRFDGPGLTPGGWRQRVGVRHLPLSSFLTSFALAGLAINRVTESHTGGPVETGGDLPWLIGVRATKL